MTYVEILQHLGIPHMESGHHHCRPGWVQMDCPDCGQDSHKYHLGLNKAQGYLNCWVCGPKPLVATLAVLSGRPGGEVVALLRQAAPIRETVVVRPRGKFQPPDGVSDMLPAHRKYLTNRGFDPDEIAALWGVRGIGIQARLSWRLYIPIHYRHEPISWTTRAIGESRMRYISARPEQERMPLKTVLYGADMAGHAIVITEGPTDAWAIGPGGVATLGLNWTPEQLERMKQYPIRVVCFDNSREAQVRARKLTDYLSLFVGETYRVCLSGKDPASSPKHEIKELRKRFLE